ncbi:MAG: flagellar hook-length control protein FliK [Burkholderiales bacterium]|nr:flagellar hook-length control protein FliK [Burkholderiales bacterium]
MPYRFDIYPKSAANIEAPSATAALSGIKQEAIPKLAHIVLGQQLKGEVLARLQDGSYTVRVAGITAKMLLPEGSKVGDAIPLRLISTNPRPTFLLDNSNKNAAASTAVFSPYLDQEALSKSTSGPEFVRLTEYADETGADTSNPTVGHPAKPIDTNGIATAKAMASAGNAADNAATRVATDADSSTPTLLSTTGKLIDQILHITSQAATSPPTINRPPVLSTVSDISDTVEAAKNLQKSLSASGLFYESHLDEWAQGKRSLADLLKEPQAQILRAAEASSASTTSPNQELAQLIHQQLDVLEQQRMVWQGDLYPGQKLEWEISKKHTSPQQDDVENETKWQSIVCFELPHLGQVTAVLNLQADKIGIIMRADRQETVSALTAHGPELAAALGQSGSPLLSFIVKQNAQA